MTTTVTAAHACLQASLQCRLVPDLVVICTGVDGDPSTLWPQEQDAVARAIPRRQREFAAGRSAARLAMKQLGIDACPILALSNRAPLWPENLVGSISHTGDACIAVVGERAKWLSVGVDLEQDMGINEELWNSICTPTELFEIGKEPCHQRAALVATLFTAKEAFYKFQFPLTKRFLDFQEVEADLKMCRFKTSIKMPSMHLPQRPGPVFHVVRTKHWIVSWVAERDPTVLNPYRQRGPEQ